MLLVYSTHWHSLSHGSLHRQQASHTLYSRPQSPHTEHAPSLAAAAVLCRAPVTIARITEGTARALARPEVKAKLDAWNQSRIGSKTPEHIKASCLQLLVQHQRTLQALLRGLRVCKKESHKTKCSAANSCTVPGWGVHAWLDEDVKHDFLYCAQAKIAEKQRAAMAARREVSHQQPCACPWQQQGMCAALLAACCCHQHGVTV